MKKNIPYIFTKEDVISQFISDVQYDNWIANKLRSSKIMKVRKGLYVLLDVTGDPLVTKFELATKIKEDAFICYHSALEFYGLANQVFYTITVSSKSRFNEFTFLDINYVHKRLKNDYGIVYFKNSSVRVTSLERTIIDCIDDIDMCGGIEELINALDQINYVDEKELLNVLKSYNSILLYQKVGYILEYYKEQLGLKDAFFDECRKHLTKQVKYFLKDEYMDIEYNSKWQLMAPKNLFSLIEGEN